ncbi:MAG: GH39 family glycosyl hydrolase [Acidimicrobiales bacterium]
MSFEITTGSGPAYNCSTGAWDPTYLDSQVALDRASGARPLLIVDYTPPCLSTGPAPGQNPAYTPPDIGPDQARWRALVTQMALHEITAEGVRAFEVWNEPDGSFWTGGLDGYLRLYADTASALEAAATTAGVHIEVGGPALLDFPGLDTTWVKALASVATTEHLPLDFLSWHVYADYPDVGPDGAFPNGLCLTGPPPGDLPCWYNPNLDAGIFGTETQQVRSILSAYPKLHPALWIDEWNVDAGQDARHDGPYDAAFVAAVLDEAQSAGLDRMSFYDVVDSSTDPTQNFGFLFSDLSPKPSYSAFVMWHRLTGRQLTTTVSASRSRSADRPGADTSVGSVASVRADGTVNVLVYNFAPYDPTGLYGTVDPNPYDRWVSVRISGLSKRRYKITRQLIDGTHNGNSVGTSDLQGPVSSVRFLLAGEGVTLLTLDPEGIR